MQIPTLPCRIAGLVNEEVQLSLRRVARNVVSDHLAALVTNGDFVQEYTNLKVNQNPPRDLFRYVPPAGIPIKDYTTVAH